MVGGRGVELQGPIGRIIPRLSTGVSSLCVYPNPLTIVFASSLDLTCKHLPGLRRCNGPQNGITLGHSGRSNLSYVYPFSSGHTVRPIQCNPSLIAGRINAIRRTFDPPDADGPFSLSFGSSLLRATVSAKSDVVTKKWRGIRIDIRMILQNSCPF